MTLAFVLGCPCGFALDFESSTVGFGISEPFERALVIGSDSRFTPVDGSNPFDFGAKVWHLEPGISATFAGRVDGAEMGLSALRRRLEHSTARDLETLAENAQEAFTNAVPKGRRSGINATSILIAVRTLEEMGVIRLDSASDFRPAVSGREQVVGEKRAAEAFYRQLALRIAPRGKMPSGDSKQKVVSNAEVLHSVAVAALRAAIIEVGGTVGGPIQTAILSARGTETLTTAAVDPEDDAWESGGELKAIRLSARPEEVRTASRRDHRRLISMAEADDHRTIVGLDEGPDGRLYVTTSGWIARRTVSPNEP